MVLLGRGRTLPALVALCLVLMSSLFVRCLRPLILLEMANEVSLKNNASREVLDCLQRRGENGQWVQDWDYAKRSNYKVYGSYDKWHLAAQNFQGNSFRWPTSWRWQDEHCPVQEISHEAFCKLCLDQGLTRFLFVGDSISVQFVFSMLSLLGFPPQGSRYTFNGMLKPFHIPCHFHDAHQNMTVDFSTTIWMYRRSPLKDLVQLKNQVDRNAFDNYYKFVASNPNRTAIVVNTGSWIQSMSDYKVAFGSLLHWLDSFPNKEKLVAFFRPSFPGHVGCRPTGADKDTYNWTDPEELHQPPYHDYTEYVQTTQNVLEAAKDNNETIEQYNWMKMEEYNDYSRDYLQHNRSDRDVKVHWLNVFNSTILRRDGHVGFGDCLHYSLPGPTDWWVHFLYSMLMGLSEAEGKRRDEKSN